MTTTNGSPPTGEVGSDQNATTAPHSFKPLRPWDLRGNGRCRRCYLPMNAHPIHYAAPARTDGRKAELTWEALHGDC